MRAYTAIVERCGDTGLYVGYIPGFPGAHTQAEIMDELNLDLREVVEMLLEDGELILEAELIDTQNIAVARAWGNFQFSNKVKEWHCLCSAVSTSLQSVRCYT